MNVSVHAHVCALHLCMCVGVCKSALRCLCVYWWGLLRSTHAAHCLDKLQIANETPVYRSECACLCISCCLYIIKGVVNIQYRKWFVPFTHLSEKCGKENYLGEKCPESVIIWAANRNKGMLVSSFSCEGWTQPPSVSLICTTIIRLNLLHGEKCCKARLYGEIFPPVWGNISACMGKYVTV